MTKKEERFEAYFEPADNIWVELTASKNHETLKFGRKVRVCAVTVSHENTDYVIVSLKKVEDTHPFYKHKFMPGLNGQIFIQPIPKTGVTELEVKVEPKSGSSIKDSVLVNISYI